MTIPVGMLVALPVNDIYLGALQCTIRKCIKRGLAKVGV